ncbi:hypothetical protein CHARACLAT_026011 [Characodon lateralis]|uniref:Uncharacterized protein n=1 Tax=Characodon lateralis TaxID=208331 RepID=A0ABU7E3W1_9TELE|nr:hypothetical protein [Characodon lateralis]
MKMLISIFQQYFTPAHTPNGTRTCFYNLSVTVRLANLWSIVKSKMTDTRLKLEATIKATCASHTSLQSYGLITSMLGSTDAAIHSREPRPHIECRDCTFLIGLVYYSSFLVI